MISVTHPPPKNYNISSAFSYNFKSALTFEEGDGEWNCWLESCEKAEECYLTMMNEGVSPQEARSVFPNSPKTEVVMTANLREWRHFFRLRTAPAAHPQMREVTIPLLHKFKELIPVVFDDIEVEGQ